MEIQVLVKSFGLGVYEAQVIPPELVNDTSDSFFEFVKAKVCEFGLGKFQGMTSNTQDVGSFFVFFNIGHEPSKYEISMMGYRLNLLKEFGEGFEGRIKDLEKYYVQIRQ